MTDHLKKHARTEQKTKLKCDAETQKKVSPYYSRINCMHNKDDENK